MTERDRNYPIILGKPHEEKKEETERDSASSFNWFLEKGRGEFVKIAKITKIRI